ncbi:hypothetical protein CC79DRAFT_1356836 [Sarocladium strictum]
MVASILALGTFVASAAAAAISVREPSVIEARQQGMSFDTTCDGNQAPNWDDCQWAFDQINAQANSDPSYFWTPPTPPAGALTWTSGNCIGSSGFQQNFVVNSVNAVQSICPTYGAGGKAQLRDYGWTMFVSMYAAKNKRDLDSGADSELETRSESDLAARQDQDGWTTAFIVENASAPQFRKQVLSGLPSGGSWTITESETISYGWEASVSISADLFGLFTASASVGYSYDESHTSTTATGIPNSCESGQTGFLYWQPTYTLYHGGFADGPSPADIYIPTGNGKYEVVCSQN